MTPEEILKFVHGAGATLTLVGTTMGNTALIAAGAFLSGVTPDEVAVLFAGVTTLAQLYQRIKDLLTGKGHTDAAAYLDMGARP